MSATRVPHAVVYTIMLVLIVVSTGCHRNRSTFGSESLVREQVQSVSTAVLETSFDTKVRVEGEVSAVCPDDGCWILINDAANVVRVELPDPIQADKPQLSGKRVIVEGILRRKLIAPKSVGFDAYEKSCAAQTQQSRQLNKGVVMDAYRVEIVDK